MTRIIFIIIFFFFSKIVSSQNNNPFDLNLSKNNQTNIGKNLLSFNNKSTSGESYSTQKMKGKLTLINFWFEACEPCVTEFAPLNALYKKFKANKKFVFISFTNEPKENALKIMRKYSIQYPVICISKERCYELNFQNGFPCTIITKSGKVVYITVGGPIDIKDVYKDLNDKLIPKIEEILKKL